MKYIRIRLEDGNHFDLPATYSLAASSGPIWSHKLDVVKMTEIYPGMYTWWGSTLFPCKVTGVTWYERY